MKQPESYIDEAIRIHKELGPGLMESVYEIGLTQSLERRGFPVERQKAIRFQRDPDKDEPFPWEADVRAVIEKLKAEKK